METAEQELRKLEKSTAKAHFNLALGLATFAILIDKLFNSSWWIILIVIGMIFLMSSLYFAFVHKWRRESCIRIAAKIKLDYVAYFIGFMGLGTALTQYNWGFRLGIVLICIASAILGVSVAFEIRRGLERLGIYR